MADTEPTESEDMDEDAESASASGDPAKKKRRKKKRPKVPFYKNKLVLLGLVTTLLMGVGGGVIAWKMLGDGGRVVEMAMPGKSIFYEYGRVVTDLAPSGGRNGFMAFKLTMEMGSEDDIAVVEEIKPRIKDAIEAHFRTVPREDLDGAAGSERLRIDLNLILNNALKPISVRGVLIHSMQVR